MGPTKCQINRLIAITEDTIICPSLSHRLIDLLVLHRLLAEAALVAILNYCNGTFVIVAENSI